MKCKTHFLLTVIFIAGGVDGRRLRHVLRDLAAVRPRGFPIHSLLPALRLPGRAGGPATDTQAKQV